MGKRTPSDNKGLSSDVIRAIATITAAFVGAYALLHKPPDTVPDRPLVVLLMPEKPPVPQAIPSSLSERGTRDIGNASETSADLTAKEGIEAWLRGDYKTAFSLLRESAQAGSAKGMVALGDIYWNNFDGVPHEEGQTVSWYRKAIDAGSADGMARLGLAYEAGIGGLPRDVSQAVSWYRKAADAGSAEGMRILGVDYWTPNDGFPKDVNQAASWFRKAADAGSVGAMIGLASMYERHRGTNDGFLPTDEAQAEYWYRRAADAGVQGSEGWSAIGMFHLGFYYEHGLGGLQKNTNQAKSWYQEAADAGNSDAESALKHLAR